MTAPKMVSFRAGEQNIARYDAAAKAAGVSRSIWLREVADAACQPNGKPKPHPDYALRRLGKTQLTTTCQHPTTAHRRLVHNTICSLCGTIVSHGKG